MLGICMEAEMGAQSDALEIVKALMQKKIDSPMQPLAMHFAGDNGIGKTHLVKLLTRALFHRASESVPGCGDGIFVFDGHELESYLFQELTPHAVRQLADYIIHLVVEQLRRCPASVIVFEDLQAIPAYVASSAIGIFCTGLPVKGVPTSRATFILLSNFGQQMMLEGLSREEVMVRILDFQDGYFTNKNLLQEVHVIPFVDYTLDDFVAIAEKKINNMLCHIEFPRHVSRCIQYDPEVPVLVASRAWAEQRRRMGRAVENMHTFLVASPLAAFLSSLTPPDPASLSSWLASAWGSRRGDVGGLSVVHISLQAQQSSGTRMQCWNGVCFSLLPPLHTKAEL